MLTNIILLNKKYTMKIQNFLPKLFDLAREVYFITDLNGIFLDISPSIYRYSGYKREELIGKNINIGFFNPDDTKKIREILDKNGRVKDLEIVLKTKDNKIKYATTNVEFILDKNCKPKGIIGVVSDITQIKLQIETLKLGISSTSRKEFYNKLTELLRKIYNADHVIVANVDFKRKAIQLKSRSTNPEIKDFVEKLKVDYHHVFKFEKEIEYLKENKYLIGYFDEDNPHFSEDTKKYHFEKWKIKSGLWYFIPFSEEQNYTIAIFHIKSKNEWKEEDLKFFHTLKELITIVIEKFNALEEQKNLCDLIYQMHACVVMTDIDGNIKYVNPAFEKVTGYKFNEVYNKNPRILKSGFHSREFYENLWNTIISGNVWKGEFVNKRKDGKLYYENSVIFPVYSEGEISGFCKVAIDVTKEKQFEKQIINSQKLKAIGEVTANIAHDFNNILTIIRGYSEITYNKVKNNSELKKNLEKVLKSVDKAQLLIKKLIKAPFSEKVYPLDISKFIKNNIELLKTLIREDIQLELNLTSTKKVLISPIELEQILINFIVNSTQAIEMDKLEKEKKIIISTKDEENSLVLSVKDTGIGIEKDKLQVIFDPFYTTKKKGKGSGLGLYIVKNIVEKYKGKIEVFSEPGKFTEFKLIFPTIEEMILTITSPESKFDINKIKDKKIAIIDDNPEILELYSNILIDVGLKVYKFSKEKDLIESIKKGKIFPDLIILDVILPQITGIELAEKIYEINPNISFLFVSGYTSELNIPEPIREKSSFLQKPFKFEELLEKIFLKM